MSELAVGELTPERVKRDAGIEMARSRVQLVDCGVWRGFMRKRGGIALPTQDALDE